MYSLHVSRRTMKDIARLPQEYAHSISQHIDQLAANPRPPGSKKLTN